jgi:hypothetical protein
VNLSNIRVVCRLYQPCAPATAGVPCNLQCCDRCPIVGAHRTDIPPPAGWGRGSRWGSWCTAPPPSLLWTTRRLARSPSCWPPTRQNCTTLERQGGNMLKQPHPWGSLFVSPRCRLPFRSKLQMPSDDASSCALVMTRISCCMCVVRAADAAAELSLVLEKLPVWYQNVHGLVVLNPRKHWTRWFSTHRLVCDIPVDLQSKKIGTQGQQRTLVREVAEPKLGGFLSLWDLVGHQKAGDAHK